MRDYDELIANLRNCAKVNSLSLYKRDLMKQAADSIEELQEDNNALNGTVANLIQQIPEISKPKWISVEERLPEKTGSYLVWMLYSHDETPAHSIINYDSDCEAFGEWDDYYDSVSLGWVGSDFIKIENVYAWMPLPEPPKEETE